MANRFRKVFIVCEDNLVFNKVNKVDIFKHKDAAEWRRDYLQKQAIEEQTKLHQVNHPMPKFKVHAFYLVHEDMFRD